ncbi:hypothetical protein F2Q68_00002260 [Brassica cretica]|uniref:Uncharacterized protein n=1 Tax=Brassica cretica TaxID=69181 RepID=A0A8S9JES5_BRACR|nr:hypothetical protein F2Q68_00002260 [Brassica cretica]
MDSSLAVTRRISFSRSRSDRPLAVTRLALLQLLGTDRSLAVTCHGMLSRSYSARIALSQSLGLLVSLEHDVIPRRHVHPWRFDCDGSSWRYVHDDVYGDLSLAVCRLTLHPWQLAPVVQNTVLIDRLRNHPGVRSLIGIRRRVVNSDDFWKGIVLVNRRHLFRRRCFPASFQFHSIVADIRPDGTGTTTSKLGLQPRSRLDLDNKGYLITGSSSLESSPSHQSLDL